MSTSADERRLVQTLSPVLSMDEVVELLGLSAATVRQLVKDGHLRAHRPPGGRKWLFRTDEVLDDVNSWSSGEDEAENRERPGPTLAEASDVVESADPSEVWCLAPTPVGGEAPSLDACAQAWLHAARRCGLEPAVLRDTEVDIDGRVYELRIGPRERVRVVDDDGEEAWQLIDAVWVEPSDPISG